MTQLPFYDKPVVDQGFKLYGAEEDLEGRLKAGDIVESRKNKDGSCTAVKSGRTEEDLFTYQAFVKRVIDGDTLVVLLDFGFGDIQEHSLRLRKIDCPELKKPGGIEARDYVISLLKEIPFIFLTSSRSDKYDRYLADVHLPGKKFLHEWNQGTANLSPSTSLRMVSLSNHKSTDLLYLNNDLLKKGHAVRMNG